MKRIFHRVNIEMKYWDLRINYSIVKFYLKFVSNLKLMEDDCFNETFEYI